MDSSSRGMYAICVVGSKSAYLVALDSTLCSAPIDAQSIEKGKAKEVRPD